jgi:predicted transcriptional regulator
VDNAKIIDVNTKGKQISLRRDIDASKPLGLASFQTTAAIKDVKIRKLDAAGQ